MVEDFRLVDREGQLSDVLYKNSISKVTYSYSQGVDPFLDDLYDTHSKIIGHLMDSLTAFL